MISRNKWTDDMTSDLFVWYYVGKLCMNDIANLLTMKYLPRWRFTKNSCIGRHGRMKNVEPYTQYKPKENHNALNENKTAN